MLNQKTKVATTLLRAKNPSGIVSIRHDNNDVKFANQIPMNGNVPKTRVNSSKITIFEMVSSATKNGMDKTLNNISDIPVEVHNTAKVEKTTTSTSNITAIVPTTVTSSTAYPTTSVTISETITSSASDVSIEEIDRSDTMFVINDSTDDELLALDLPDDIIKKSNGTQSRPIAHISNSVVLTKAKSKSVDNRTNGGSRNLSSEPANVVIVKLSNASKQGTGTNINPSQSMEIPIIEALSFATNIENAKSINAKVASVDPLEKSSPQKEFSTIFIRSNSIPTESSSNLSPRAAKRSFSLNCVQSPKISTVAKDLESSESSKNSSQSIQKMSVVCDIYNELTCDGHGDSPSPGEIDKENNEVSFIELEDSFAEDFSEESNVSENHNGNTITAFEIKTQKRIQQIDQNNTGKQEQILGEKTSLISTITPKDEDEKTSTNSKPTTIRPKNGLNPTPVAIVKSNSGKNEKEDQVIKSLLCNETIMTITPSSSSSASSSTQNPLPSAAISNTSQMNVRSALAPRVRDQNRIIDANASSARRLCRDSSIASALSMVSTFDMLNWKEDRIASARGTAMRFELNEFNLLQVHERGCPPRYRIHTPYERPIYERFSSMPKTDQTDPLLYLCRKCKLYGPAVDFLAPEFCSVDCLKRTLGKRGAREIDILENIAKKRARKSAPDSATNKAFINISNSSKQTPIFRWSIYLSNMRNTVAAPIDLFLNPFPTGPNPFTVGMKVEAIDPENCSLFCVCTIVQIQGYRLRLNFDGYNSVYDFWVNADSMDIFPPGWCAKTNRILQPPRGCDPNKFDWPIYLKKTNSVGADKKFFTHLNSSSSITNRNPFTVGMFLEADDLNDTGKLCVASAADVLDERIRVHFDGWDDCYDYWVDISSPYIHPCGWHEGRQQLLVPPEYGTTSFNWRDYIRESQGLAAPTDFFVSRDPIDYRPGMKLEVVDPRNPCLIRPATVVHRTRHRVKIHFDCWPSEYTFSLEDDSPDLHPIGWCDATGHELEPPPGFQQQQKVLPCNTMGCRGLGNMDRSNGLTHANREFCPYVLENWRSKPEKAPRVEGKDIVRKIRQELSCSSLLKTSKRQYNHGGSCTELPKEGDKILNIPYKQPTRGRPRNCDRLAAAAAAAAAHSKQKKELQILQHNQADSETKKIEIEHPDIKQVKRESPVQVHCNTLIPSSTPTTTTTPENKILIAKRFLCDYGPRLKQNYDFWRQNAGVDVALKVQRNPILWSTAETCAFIDATLSECNADMARYAVSSKFYMHDIDGAALLMLQQQDLTEILEFKIGPAVKLCSIILQLRMLVVSKYGSEPNQKETVNKPSESFKIDSDRPK